MFDKTLFAIGRWFWKCFRALAGIIWELRGMSLGISEIAGSTQKGFQIHLGPVLGLVCLLVAAKDGLGTVRSSFGASRT